MISTAASSWAALCELAGALLHDHPAGPMDQDLVVVPSAGHRRALSQALASRTDGPAITAGLDFVTTAALPVRIAESLEVAGLLPADGWRGVGLQLGIMQALADPANADQLADLLRHISNPEDRPGRAFTTASRLASTFRRYGLDAPEMIASWRAGDDLDFHGDPLAPGDRWQPALWRALSTTRGPDPALRRESLLAALRTGPVPGLPHRIVVVQVDDPDPALRHLIDALAVHHDVAIFALSGLADDGGPGSGFARRHGSRPALLDAVPSRPTEAPGTLLEKVQQEVRRGAPPARRSAADSSLQIHACHGPNRQVEVLRDVLCGLFSDDPTLQPRDVVVLCPDLAAYAPLISASFCLDADQGSELHPGHRLRAQLAAPALTAVNPVLEVVGRCFDLYEGRATSVDLVDLCRMPPIALRFGFDADALDRLHQLVARAEIRWGIDQEQRRRNGVPVPASTWLAGVQRMLLSLALDDAPPTALDTTSPVAFVEGGDAALIGSLAELVSRLRKICQGFASPAPAEVWTQRLREAVDLLTSSRPEEAWQLDHALSELATLAAESAGTVVPLTSGDVANWLRDRSQSWTRRPNYGNGSMVFTSLDDLATIEARVVCVLGLDDDRFPGAPGIDGDDLLARPGPNSRHWTADRRARRRQRLLDALLAARQTLVVVTQGASEATGAIRPLPLCIAELQEACAISGANGAWRGGSGPGALVRWHPMHPHGWGDFVAEGRERPMSFDTLALKGARRLFEPPSLPEPHWQGKHSVTPQPDVDIEELIDFYRHPAKELLRRATGTSLGTSDNSLAVDLPIDHDWLQAWRVGQALFDLLVDGHDAQSAQQAVWLGGLVLPGPMGESVLVEQLDKALPIARAVLAARAGDQQLIDCSIDLGEHRVSGRVRLFDDTVETHRFGSDKADDFLSLWLQLVLLSGSEAVDHSSVSGVAIAKNSWRFTAPDPATARRWLAEAVALREAGLQQVLPLPLTTASAHQGLTGYAASNDPLDRARGNYPNSDANWSYFFSGFNEMAAIAPHPADPRSTTGPESSRFGQLAGWLVGPLKSHRTYWRPTGGRP